MKPIHSAGIDKITATTFDFEVRDIRNGAWRIKSNTQLTRDIADAQYLLTDRTGEVARGDYLYHNSKDTGANYTMSRIKTGGTLSMSVNFNPSKMAHPHVLAPTESDAFKHSMKRIEKELADIGVLANLSDMKAYRVDVAKQASMSMPVEQYGNAFKMLNAGRMNQREYPGGHQFLNTQTCCAFYDKEAEMRARKLDQSIIGMSNFMRAEVRALDGKSVGRILNISTLADLRRMDYQAMDHAYTRCMKNKVFGSANHWEQLSLNIDDEVEVLKRCLTYGSNGWMAYFAMDGIDNKLNQLGGIKVYRSMLEAAGMSRQHTYKVLSLVRQMMKDKARYDRAKVSVTPAMLLDELVETFLAA